MDGRTYTATDWGRVMTAAEEVMTCDVPRPSDIPEGFVHRTTLKKRGWGYHYQQLEKDGRALRTQFPMQGGLSVWWYPVAEVARMEADDPDVRKAVERAALIVPRRDGVYEPHECLGRTRLRERGWKPSEIEKYLGAPDAEIEGYHRTPAHLWSKERIEAAESGDTTVGARLRKKSEEAAAARAAKEAEIARQRAELAEQRAEVARQAAEAQKVRDAEFANRRAAEQAACEKAFRTSVRADLLMNTDSVPVRDRTTFTDVRDEFVAAYVTAATDVQQRVTDNAIDAAVARVLDGDDIPEITREWARAQHRALIADEDPLHGERDAERDARQVWGFAHSDFDRYGIVRRPWIPSVKVVRAAATYGYSVPEPRFAELDHAWWVLSPPKKVREGDTVWIAKRDGSDVERTAHCVIPIGAELVLVRTWGL
ncbi:hypothetical protein [Mycobacteroides abscessus]|uniref:hypothetical protein n=1 Tax=Mycobacteroides abscessus TaxID=36809 RepID=UPI0014902DA5|nr:hypothetical protein [Mycobacteroides abscessus]NOS27198.1 hypothetical protein [Mycobacteroides abscessus]